MWAVSLGLPYFEEQSIMTLTTDYNCHFTQITCPSGSEATSIKIPPTDDPVHIS